MRKTSIILAAVSVFGLAGCLENDVERGVVGAGAGLAVSEVFGTDRTASVAAGAVAGVLCDNAGVRGCQ